MKRISSNITPPKLAAWILRKVTSWHLRYSVMGDFEEIYRLMESEKGRLIAKFWYWFQVLKSIPPFIKDKILWGAMMFNNYFKLTIRNMIKNKQSSFINIFGLSIAIGVCIVSYLFIELNYYRDTFHENVLEILPFKRQLA